MRLLLDTHVVLWWLADDPALPRTIRAALADPSVEALVSAATAWEIAIKRALGRLDFPADELESILKDNGFKPLPITTAHAVAAGALPRHHADPFDRMLVAQAACESLTLASVDPMVARYGVPVLNGV
ncbi:PilT protein domain-containing protein [Paramagnetospirillum caucaseum]|uniref:PilT protein domain-containing protein n=1 Tax=Paramagnetospirillum caucaseum TaxID=1244869 RepID=M3ABS5_9PROT|nr:type II toxin-antitoxin system VapC family toxin [Paramagnetospirillum caucaseum]EME70233.1 PilT protein domain-containing protein [Paramagnetospirillum caucaseum]